MASMDYRLLSPVMPNEAFMSTVLHDGRPIAQHNEGGEFSGIFQNEERSVEDRVAAWKASHGLAMPRDVTLARRM